jgi:hypothetical protein
MAKNKGISINQDFVGIDIKGDFEPIDNILNTTSSMIMALEKFDYYGDINLKDLHSKELLYLSKFTSHIIMGEQIKLFTKNCSGILSFGNAKIFLVIIIDEKGYTQFINIFDNENYFIFVEELINGKKMTLPILLRITPYILSCADNIHEEKVIDYIKKISFIEDYVDIINQIALNFISAYDLNNHKKPYLNIAKRIYEFLPSTDIFQINICQIKKRLGTLNSDDKRELVKIKNNTEFIEAKCAINLLLGYFEEFELFFDMLIDEKKESFKRYPIYSLFNKS